MANGTAAPRRPPMRARFGLDHAVDVREVREMGAEAAGRDGHSVRRAEYALRLTLPVPFEPLSEDSTDQLSSEACM